MGTCSSNSWCGRDPDKLFSYQTVRVARVNDRRLGLLHYGFMVLILGYIVGYSIIYQKNYLLRVDPTGTVRMSLLKPDEKLLKATEELVYCTTNTQPYNTTDQHGTVHGCVKQECLYYDADFVQFPATEQTAILASTRVTNKTQTMSAGDRCNPPKEKDCEFTGPSATFFIAELEKYTLMLAHTMSAPVVGQHGIASKMQGRLLDTDGNEVNPCDDYKAWGQECPKNQPPGVYVSIGELGYNDVLPLQTLLRAGGLKDGLDSYFDEDAKGVAETMRYSGIVVLLEIMYDNTIGYNTSDTRYTYNVNIVDGAEFKAEELTSQDSRSRTLLDRHGVRLVVVQTGQIGRFDMQVLLLSLVTSLGLIAVSTTVVDFLALNILPEKGLYAKYKQIETVDFTDLRDELEGASTNTRPVLENAHSESVKTHIMDEERGLSNPSALLHGHQEYHAEYPVVTQDTRDRSY